MGEKVRRHRLLVAVGLAGLLAFVAAWPSQSAATEPQPLYLARDRAPGGSSPAPTALLVIGDAARLPSHLLAEREDIAALEVIDSAGQVVVLNPNGKVVATGTTLDPVVVRTWVQESFAARTRTANRQVSGGPVGSTCGDAKQAALNRLKLPTTHDGKRELSLAETLAEADGRIAAMHEPANQVPIECIPLSSHRAGYLHNLWHRITGS